MINNPSISIIIPIFRVENFLTRCLDSVLAQTYTDFELLLIDDGSPDNSGKICDEYAKKDKRIKVFHKKNEGVSVARNVGLDNARGKYVAFIDSDDWVEVDYLSCLYTTAEDQCADIVACDYLIEKGSTTPVYMKQKHVNDRLVVIKMLLTNELKGYLWNRLFRRNLFSVNQIRFSAGIGMWEDLEVLVALCYNASKIAYLPLGLYHYSIINQQTATYSYDEKKISQRIYITHLLKDFLKAHGLEKSCIRELHIRQLLAKMEYATDVKLHNFKKWNETFPDAFNKNWSLNYPLWIKIQQWLVHYKLYPIAYVTLLFKRIIKY